MVPRGNPGKSLGEQGRGLAKVWRPVLGGKVMYSYNWRDMEEESLSSVRGTSLVKGYWERERRMLGMSGISWGLHGSLAMYTAEGTAVFSVHNTLLHPVTRASAENWRRSGILPSSMWILQIRSWEWVHKPCTAKISKLRPGKLIQVGGRSWSLKERDSVGRRGWILEGRTGETRAEGYKYNTRTRKLFITQAPSLAADSCYSHKICPPLPTSFPSVVPTTCLSPSTHGLTNLLIKKDKFAWNNVIWKRHRQECY